MSISKISLWLSVLVACLVLIASGIGLLLKGFYARETASWAVQTFGQDIANLVTAIILLMAVYFVGRGSIRAFLVWMGSLITLLYAYIIYAFDIHFNSLFLVYVAIVGLSFYSLSSSMFHLHRDSLQPSFVATSTAKVASVFYSCSRCCLPCSG